MDGKVAAQEADRPLIVRIAPDIFAFAFWLLLAYLLKWQTKDLVWSLWLSSLVTGYLTILSILAAGATFGSWVIHQEGFDPSQRKAATAAGVGVGLFLLVFFSVHFCGFHAGHSVFLNSFFPVEGMPNDGFGAAFMNPPLLWFLVFKHLMAPYGLFLVPALIAERHHLVLPFFNALKLTQEKGAQALRGQTWIKDATGRPYLNVIRMHLLIFFFAFCHFLKIDNFLVYMVVYSVYFFPWSELRTGLRPVRSSVSV